MTILAALERLYDREIASGSANYSIQPIDFLIVLDRDGRVQRVEDRRIHGNKVRSGEAYAPSLPKRSGSAPAANIFWDKSDFVLGIGPSATMNKWKGKSTCDKQGAVDPEMIEAFNAKAGDYNARFVEANRPLVADVADPCLVAFRNFLDIWDPLDFEDLIGNDEVRDAWVMLACEIDGELRLIHEGPDATAIIDRERNDDDGFSAVCLVSGRKEPVARIHESVDLGLGDRVTLSSFNEDAFSSHGWSQGANSPMSKRSAIAVAKALSHLVKTGRSVRIGDQKLVFWAEVSGEAAEEVDLLLAECLGARSEAGKADEAAAAVREDIRRVLSGENGASGVLPDDVTVWTMLIGANSTRAIVSAMGEMGLSSFLRSYRLWQSDLAIPGAEASPVPNWVLARSLAPWRDGAYKEKKDKDLIHVVKDGQAALLKAVLSDTRLPAWILPRLISRIGRDGHVSAERMALINAAVRRAHRALAKPMINLDKGHLMTDIGAMHPAWHAGRIFALLERAQEYAVGSPGAGIGIKFLAQAAARPAAVLPRLIISARQRHIPKLLAGRVGASWMKGKPPALVSGIGRSIERDLGQSLVDADVLPARFTSEEQGIFLIGYYAERQKRFAKNSTNETDNTEPEEILA